MTDTQQVQWRVYDESGNGDGTLLAAEATTVNKPTPKQHPRCPDARIVLSRCLAFVFRPKHNLYISPDAASIFIGCVAVVVSLWKYVRASRLENHSGFNLLLNYF